MELVFAKADQVFDLVSQHSTLWIYLFVFLSMIIENIIPPFPGDTVVFICGVYAAGGHASWALIYALAVVGTMISVMMLYFFGRHHGRAAFRSPRVRWLGLKHLDRVERWFTRWGDKALLFSRWLAGIRALLALFAGVGNVRSSHFFFYTLISTLTWNFAVLFLALRLRRDWQMIDHIFAAYGLFILIGIGIIVVIVVAKRYYFDRKSSSL
jgi:membrane protein DedA with SNARE-associated domain